MIRRWKVFYGLILGILLFNTSLGYSQGTVEVGRTLYATIIEPTMQQLLADFPDPVDSRAAFYQEKQTLRGLAERGAPVQISILNKIPELISNWSARHNSDGSLQLDWTPRADFFCQGDAAAGCKPGQNFYAILRPGIAYNLETIMGADMPPLPVVPPDGLEHCTNNNEPCTKEHEGPEGGSCTYHYQYVREWLNEAGEVIPAQRTVADKDIYEKKPHSYTVQVKQVITGEWLKTAYQAGSMCGQERQPFWIETACAATPASGGGGSVIPDPSSLSTSGGYVPTCSLAGNKIVDSKKMQILVDDFAQYAIVAGKVQTGQVNTAVQPLNANGNPFANPDNIIFGEGGVSYYLHKKISDCAAQNNSACIGGWTGQAGNPLTKSVQLKGLDPQTTYRLALFEVRRITCYEHSPYPPEADCSQTPVDTAGYLYTARTANGGNELEVAPQGVVQYPPATPAKVELELIQNLTADREEHFTTQFHKMSLNPAARTHFLPATYVAKDIATSQRGSSQGLSLLAASKIAFFHIQDIAGGLWQLAPNVQYASQTPAISGVVFDTWTKEPLPGTFLKIQGQASLTGEVPLAQTTEQYTNLDGMYVLYVPPGRYQVLPGEVQAQHNNFLYAANARHDCAAPDILPYGNAWYGGEIVRLIRGRDLQRDIPLAPLLCGTAVPHARITVRNLTTHESYTVSVLPDGKFSFFIPAGSYTVEKMVTQEGSTRTLSIPVSVDTTPTKIDINA